MSEIKRAISLLEALKSETVGTVGQDYLLDIAINALEKQIPYKPTKCNITCGRCKCGVGFIDKETQHCGNCGQKLDWGDSI